MRKSILAYCTTFLLACTTLFSQENDSFPYKLSTPGDYAELPDTLHEISGITTIDTTTIACIQDENGILFMYDPEQHKLKTQFTFGANGDYEDLACVGKSIYVLRSDGVIFEIPDYTLRYAKVNAYFTGIPAKDNEGLCYDKEKNRLLIACKGTVNGKAYRNKRAVFSFNLLTRQSDKTPAFEFDMKDVYAFAANHNIVLPPKIKKGGKVEAARIRFLCSAIAIHPFSKKLYLLSAADHLLFVCGNDGALENIFLLDPLLFHQPEGITFLENGDLLISNEAHGKKPTLLRFKYKKP